MILGVAASCPHLLQGPQAEPGWQREAPRISGSACPPLGSRVVVTSTGPIQLAGALVLAPRPDPKPTSVPSGNRR